VADPTGEAAMRPDQAVAWLADLEQLTAGLVDRVEWRDPLVARIIILANQAACWWPPLPAKGQRIGTTTVGARNSTVTENCALCNAPLIPGHIRRVDGRGLCKSPCWYAITTGRAKSQLIPKPA
jgi:hypothetical protein